MPIDQLNKTELMLMLEGLKTVSNIEFHTPTLISVRLGLMEKIKKELEKHGRYND